MMAHGKNIFRGCMLGLISMMAVFISLPSARGQESPWDSWATDPMTMFNIYGAIITTISVTTGLIVAGLVYRKWRASKAKNETHAIEESSQSHADRQQRDRALVKHLSHVKDASSALTAGRYKEGLAALRAAEGAAREAGRPDKAREARESIDGLLYSWRGDLESDQAKAMDMAISGEYEQAIPLLGRVEQQAKDAGLPDIVIGTRERIESTATLRKLSRVLKASRKIRLSDVCAVLNKDTETMIPLLLEWSKTIGFEIEGEFIVISRDLDRDATIAAMDREFAWWTENERKRRGKI